MTVEHFVSVYPYPLGIVTSGVECTISTFANNANWKQHILSGAMAKQADEFLYVHHLGHRHASEHPPSAFEAIIGAPSFETHTFVHGDPNGSKPVFAKTIHWYARGLPAVHPTCAVPDQLQRDRPSHSDADVQMVLRSSMTRHFALAHVNVWDLPPYGTQPNRRPAWMPSDGYAAHRAQMVCNMAAFASQYAPSRAIADGPGRVRMLIAVPIGYGTDPVSGNGALCALVRHDGASFCTPLVEGTSLLSQMAQLAQFLPCHEQPQHMHVTRDTARDVIFALPVTFQVTGAVSDIKDSPRRRNLHSCWCTAEALSTLQYVYTSLAMERARSFTSAVPWLRASIGVTNHPVPVTTNRAAALYRSGIISPDAQEKWAAFLVAEEERHTLVVRAFEAADNGTGLLDSFIGNIHTASTRAHELTPPPQGLPDIDVATISMMPRPLPPMPLHTSYLPRLPPQQLPDRFPESLAYSEVIRRWGRRIVASCINTTAAHDFECVLNGWSDLPRHPFCCLGAGAFHNFHFADGIGSLPLNMVLLRVCDDGRLRPTDFEYMDHKDLAAIIGIFGFSTDKELLSFLIHGVRWKVPWPRQIRFSHNVFSLKSRAVGVGDATARLIDKGLYIATPVLAQGQQLTEDSPCPLATTPQYSQGMGGQDKKDKPDEKRPCANDSDPHNLERERNSPHGDPDGPVVVSKNDMTGLKKYPPGFTGYKPFPDKEHKHSNREIYASLAIDCALAAINGTTPCASKDDVRWMFFQIYTEPCEYWTSVEYLVILTCPKCKTFFILCICVSRDDAIAILYKIVPKVTNMGLRPASKVAVRFSKHLNDEWRERMADYVHACWLPKQSQALRDVLRQRELTLGYEQAHPFGTFEFTDDFLDHSCDIQLTAHGAVTRRRIAKQLNLWMSSKNEAGTVVDYIGGRHVISGGFGTLSPEKRTRCVQQCTEALHDRLDLDDFLAHNSYLVHVKDLLNLNPVLLEGNWAPMGKLRFGNVMVRLSATDEFPEFARVATNYVAIRHEVATKPAAAFTTGIFDAPSGAVTSPNAQPTLYVRMSSDCMANGVQTQICGALLEYEWAIDLTAIDSRWAQRHITVGESTGAAVNVAVFGESFHMFELIQEGDNTVEGPMMLGRAKTADQRAVGQSMRATSGYRACCQSLWFEHSNGLGLGFTDAGSRSRDDVQTNLAAAFGRRRVRLSPTRSIEVLHMLSSILEGTTEYVKPKRYVDRQVRFSISKTDQRELEGGQLEVEVARGVCPSADNQNSASQARSLSPTPPRPPASAHATSPVRRPIEIAPTPPRPPATGRPPTPTASTAIRAADSLEPTPPRLIATAPSLPSGSPCRHDDLPPSPELCSHDTRSQSPQPLTAAAARAAASIEDTAHITAGSNPHDRRMLQRLCAAAHTSEVNGIPRGTRGHDEWGFKWVRRFATSFGLRWMLPRYVPENQRRQFEKFAALALFHIVPLMKPSKRTRDKGIDQAMPPSGINAIYGWRRVMRDCGRHVVDMAAAGRQLRGMIETLKRTYGQNAMAVRHHIPYPLDTVLRAVDYLEHYRCPQWSRALHDALCVVIKFNMARGPRLDEWCEMYSGDTFYRRANFSWSRGERLLGSTQAADAESTVTNGDIIRGMNVPSKTDRTGAKMLGKYIWYIYDDTNPLNFAAAWARFERRYACPEHDRCWWPAFSPTASHEPFKPTPARAMLSTILTSTEGPDFAEAHVWHDFRATIATALTAAKQEHGFTQAVVGWASAASVELYGQLKPLDMARRIELASRTDASRHAHVVTPHHSEETVAAELEACAEHLENATLQTATPRNSGASSSQPPQGLVHSHVATSKARGKSKAHSAPTPQPPAQSKCASSKRATNMAYAPTPDDSLAASTTPPTMEPSAATYSVGPPLGTVTVAEPHALDGTKVKVYNSSWSASAPGRTPCTIMGHDSLACIDGNHGVFVVRDDTSSQRTMYAFTERALWTSLTPLARKQVQTVQTPDVSSTSAAALAAPKPRQPPKRQAAQKRTPSRTASPIQRHARKVTAFTPPPLSAPRCTGARNRTSPPHPVLPTPERPHTRSRSNTPAPTPTHTPAPTPEPTPRRTTRVSARTPNQ